ncbi:protein transport protein Sec24A [Coccinella septempunctata]|uniref:protein transport protein Sec24A n=1 Tax=Coccinella septempunctata TaxID=41139 RepID=UPI001D06683F|nr:protein transport protein Sec24A [Coccinella septempunctata]XP_044749389.1 protein transport protein Sec24A [Coccinella septempunctata]
MSGNNMNGSPNPLEPAVNPAVKPVPQYNFNGITSLHKSSRGSSPLSHNKIPSSQLPPSRIPASQLPSSSVTHKVSQSNLQHQLPNVMGPQYFSTPNENVSLLKTNVSTGLGSFSPVTTKNNIDSSLHQNFLEISLNDNKSTKSDQSREDEYLNSRSVNAVGSMDDVNTYGKPLNSKLDNLDNKGVQLESRKFSNHLFPNDNMTRSNNDATRLSQHNPFLSNSSSNSDNKLLGNNPIGQQIPLGQQVQTPQTTLGQPVPFQQMQISKSGMTQSRPQPNIRSPPYSVAAPTNPNMMPGLNNIPAHNPPLPPISNDFVQRPSSGIRPFNSNVIGNQAQNNPRMPPMPQKVPSYHPVPPGNIQQTSIPPKYPPSYNGEQNRIPPLSQPMSPLNQPIPPSTQNFSPSHTRNVPFQPSKYPTIPPQQAARQASVPPYNQQYQSQNQQFNSGYGPNQTNQYQAQYGQNVVSQGFNKLWGMENYDLLQTINILPAGKIPPPKILLGNEILNSANCSGEIFRSTLTKIPESQSLLQKSRLPLGILIHPFKDLTQLSVIQCNVIVRCRACRTYINPFVSFVDSKRWKCNLCYRVNDLPEEFQYDPVSKTFGDPSRRPEIRSSTIEYIAPAEYMLRPPQPAVYLFLLDISRLAVECGYLNLFCSVLKEELVNLPGDSRTQVGFIAYDSCLHFFSFAEGLSQPHEMMVLDIDDIFLPCPDNLLVNLKDKMELIGDLLNQLPTRYNNSYDSNSALGAALQAAHRMMSPTGGRVTVFQASLPNVGPGALTPREDPNQRSAAEVQNLKPANDFYKRLALDCSSQQIAVDLFIINSQYIDIATISGISRFSGGCIQHFPLFKYQRPIVSDKLERYFRRYLIRKVGFEAVMRIRCTRGMSIHTFHGNFFVRSTDLLSLPNVNPDAGFGMQVSIEENLSDVDSVCFQAALLYTSSKGERRIRVHTLCLPVVSALHEVIHSADQQCIVGLLAKMAVDRSVESSLSDAREAFINVVIDILSSYKLSLNLGSTPNGLLAPNCLKLLPLYISALLKSQAFRTGTSTRLDDRVKAMIDMKTLPLTALIQYIYPDLYPVHNLEDQQIILSVEEVPIHVPPRLQLTSRHIDNIGAYLMDIGDHMILYVCSGVSQVFLNEGLGVQSFNSLNDQMYEIPMIENATNHRLVSFVNYLNEEKPHRATVQVIKDNSPNRGAFLERLIEDRFENALSYHEFLQHIKAQVK